MANYMKASSLVECICAMHLSSYVEGMGQHRGGMFLIGPPGVMKTTFLDFLRVYENAHFCSDLNSKNLNAIKASIQAQTTRSICFPDFGKLYERDPRTAFNLEGTIKAMAEEGFSGASYEAQGNGISRFVSRATMIGAMTVKRRDDNWQRWDDDGFTRRFLWCLIRLEDPDVLMRAVENWERHEIAEDILIPTLPFSGSIPMSLTSEDRKKLRMFVRYQPKPNNFAFEMICRLGAVLKWHYSKRKTKRDALSVLAEFASCLGETGCDVRL